MLPCWALAPALAVDMKNPPIGGGCENYFSLELQIYRPIRSRISGALCSPFKYSGLRCAALNIVSSTSSGDIFAIAAAISSDVIGLSSLPPPSAVLLTDTSPLRATIGGRG